MSFFLWLSLMVFGMLSVPVRAESLEIVENEELSVGIAEEKLCDADEYVLIPTAGNGKAAIFDSSGEQVGECRVLIEANRPCIVKKESFLSFSDGKTCYVYSFGALDTILELPEEKYMVYASSEWCMTAEKATGEISMYDQTGKKCWSISGEPTDETFQGSFSEMGDGFLIRIYRYDEEENKVVIPGAPTWVSKDGKTIRKIRQPEVVEAVADGAYSIFGGNLLIYHWEEGTISVYDADGKMALKGKGTLLYGSGDYNLGVMYAWDPEFLLMEETGKYTVYDRNLQICGSMAITDILPSCETGFVCGLPYEELGGRVCSDFVWYGDGKRGPAAKADGGWYVYTENGLEFVPVSAGETLDSFSEAFVLTRWWDEDGNYAERILDRKTGEEVARSESEENYGRGFQLREAYCIISEWGYGEEGGWSRYSVMDNHKTIRFSSDKSQCYAWKGEYVILNRGIYTGLADLDGNWMLKTSGSWSE